MGIIYKKLIIDIEDRESSQSQQPLAPYSDPKNIPEKSTSTSTSKSQPQEKDENSQKRLRLRKRKHESRENEEDRSNSEGGSDEQSATDKYLEQVHDGRERKKKKT